MSQTISYTKDNLRNSDDFRVTVHRQKEYLLQTGQWSFLDMNRLKHLSRKASPRQYTHILLFNKYLSTLTKLIVNIKRNSKRLDEVLTTTWWKMKTRKIHPLTKNIHTLTFYYFWKNKMLKPSVIILYSGSVQESGKNSVSR